MLPTSFGYFANGTKEMERQFCIGRCCSLLLVVYNSFDVSHSFASMIVVCSSHNVANYFRIADISRHLSRLPS